MKLFNYPNMVESLEIFSNVSNCMQIYIKRLYTTQIGTMLFEVSQKCIKLFEITLNRMNMFHLAQTGMELLPCGQD